jgi:hypothetical protein
VLSLPGTETVSSFPVQWTGSDIGAGIQDFTIYVSDNGGPYNAWLTNTTATQATYTGINGHTYSFNSIARDLVGNVEGAKSAAEATTTVDVSNGAVALFGTIAAKQGTQDARQWTILVGNSGNVVATAAQITGIQFTQTALGGGPACTPTVTSPSIPLSLGDIAPGGFAQGTLTIDFAGCANAARFTVLAELASNSGAATGSILRNDEER